MDARNGGDHHELEHLHNRLRADIKGRYDELSQLLDDAGDFPLATDRVRRLMFLEKLLHEIDDALASLVTERTRAVIPVDIAGRMAEKGFDADQMDAPLDRQLARCLTKAGQRKEIAAHFPSPPGKGRHAQPCRLGFILSV